jgi:hypothetical protein
MFRFRQLRVWADAGVVLRGIVSPVLHRPVLLEVEVIFNSGAALQASSVSGNVRSCNTINTWRAENKEGWEVMMIIGQGSVAGCLANLDSLSRTVEDRIASNEKSYSNICSTCKVVVALHLLREVVGTPMKDRTVSNVKSADLATVPRYIPTQYLTQLDPLGAPTFIQAVPNAFAFPNKHEHIMLASAMQHNLSVHQSRDVL